VAVEDTCRGRWGIEARPCWFEMQNAGGRRILRGSAKFFKQGGQPAYRARSKAECEALARRGRVTRVGASVLSSTRRRSEREIDAGLGAGPI